MECRLLILIYINDLGNDSDIIIFADDTDIFIQVTSQDAAYNARGNHILEKF